MKNLILYIFFKLFQYLVFITPNFILKPILDTIAWILFVFDKKHRHIAKINIEYVFKDSKDKEFKSKLLRDCYNALVYNFADMVQNQLYSKEKILSKVEFEGDEMIDKYIQDGEIIVFFGAHYSNWELITQVMPLRFSSASAVGRALSIEYINRDLIKSRQRFGTQMIDEEGSAKAIFKAIKKHNIIGFLIDQNTLPHRGEIVKFCDMDVRMSSASARIATKVGAKLVPFWISSDKFGKYKCSFGNALEYDSENTTNKSILELTQKQSDIIEDYIKNRPLEWLWFHKKFKAFYEESYSINNKMEDK